MEERRLFYVGITRAKDQLYLVYSQNRTSYGYAEPAEASRFLADIPEEMLQETIARTRPRGGRQAEARPERWQATVSKETVQQRFHPGMRVEHPTWGEGMILNSRLQDEDEIVDIFFENVGLKKVAASLARLEIKT
jgi:DNA helicase-2/ATP-dependent DNA helicase PcrA